MNEQIKRYGGIRGDRVGVRIDQRLSAYTAVAGSEEGRGR